MKKTTGSTLLEVLLGSVILSGIVTSFFLAQVVVLDRGEVATARDQQLARAHQALEEIEHAIRFGDTVERAGDDLLVVSARYFVDSDDGSERIRYRQISGTLQRDVAQGSGPYGAPETIAEGVLDFHVDALFIKDNFDDADYGGSGGLLSLPAILLDPKSNCTFDSVAELGGVDDDLVNAFDSATERLSLTTASLSESITVTVSPPLAKNGLQAVVKFTPLDSGGTYSPLVYGDVSKDWKRIALVFSGDGTIRLRRFEAGTLMEEALAPVSWSPQTYRVKLAFDGGAAEAFVCAAGTEWRVGAIDSGSIDNESLHFESAKAGHTGYWDDLRISYPLVKIVLTLDRSGNAVDVYGGAVGRRS